MGCTHAGFGAKLSDDHRRVVVGVIGGARLFIGVRAPTHREARAWKRALPATPARAGAGVDRRQGGESEEANRARARSAGGSEKAGPREKRSVEKRSNEMAAARVRMASLRLLLHGKSAKCRHYSVVMPCHIGSLLSCAPRQHYYHVTASVLHYYSVLQ